MSCRSVVAFHLWNRKVSLVFCKAPWIQGHYCDPFQILNSSFSWFQLSNRVKYCALLYGLSIFSLNTQYHCIMALSVLKVHLLVLAGAARMQFCVVIPQRSSRRGNSKGRHLWEWSWWLFNDGARRSVSTHSKLCLVAFRSFKQRFGTTKHLAPRAEVCVLQENGHEQLLEPCSLPIRERSETTTLKFHELVCALSNLRSIVCH